MKCTYTKPCEVRKDGSCGASILGYCGFQEKPEPPKLVEPVIDQYSYKSQDEWVQQTIAKETSHANAHNRQ